MNTEYAKALLRAQGYVVIPRDRHVVLEHRRFISDEEQAISKEYAAALNENAREFVIRQIGRTARNEGLLLEEARLADFPRPGRVVTIRACFIKPRAPDEVD